MSNQSSAQTTPRSHGSNPSASTESEMLAREQVLERSRQWIAAFNRGDVGFCVAAYTSNAVMEAKPIGTFAGTEEIDGFWRPFISSGASQLAYDNVVLRVIDDHTVLLAADWSMNVGSGVITEERWIKRDDGCWLLEHDAFEILHQTS